MISISFTNINFIVINKPSGLIAHGADFIDESIASFYKREQKQSDVFIVKMTFSKM